MKFWFGTLWVDEESAHGDTKTSALVRSDSCRLRSGSVAGLHCAAHPAGAKRTRSGIRRGREGGLGAATRRHLQRQRPSICAADRVGRTRPSASGDDRGAFREIDAASSRRDRCLPASNRHGNRGGSATRNAVSALSRRVGSAPNSARAADAPGGRRPNRSSMTCRTNRRCDIPMIQDKEGCSTGWVSACSY